MELQSVLHCHIVVASANDESVFLSEFSLVGQCCLALVVNVLYEAACNLHETAGNSHALLMYAHTMRLHHGSVAIDVYHKSRNVVALSMNQSVCVVLRIIHYADGPSHVVCRQQTALPELVVDIHVAEREHTHCYGTYLVVSHSNEIASGSDNPHHLAFLYVSLGPLNGT